MSSDSYSVIRSIVNSAAKKFLATIIQVEGSAYRKEGTMMLFTEKGEKIGLLSGGCVEQDVLARIEMNKEVSHVIYDMRSEDDLSWGQGVGCDGSIQLLIEPITPVLQQNYSKVKKLLDKGIGVSHFKVLDSDFKVVHSFFISEAGGRFGEIPEYPIEKSHYKNKTLAKNSSGNGYVFRNDYSAPPRLVIYGAGPDVLPVVRYAKGIGFHIILADWREGLCNRKKFPLADEFIVANPKEAMEKIQLSAKDFVLIMTHNFMKDKDLIDYLLFKEVAFVGLLGSRKRGERLMGANARPRWFHYPVGLSIGAEGPDEIAVSIIAQLILVKNKVSEKEKAR
ncbi:XdhC family protein [Niallia sp. NCCP-28]|uniref:XdhC family protein n=1 Tax=Niallia sp. NCCP-28 TaxID=2934712 RepID=UPI002081CF7C|nr:XdhC family protein [Niallia sp. NCCP-28]GKU82864.1 putative xanthine dehydrogenase subunit A [Niallia sp. NCCP-28]